MRCARSTGSMTMALSPTWWGVRPRPAPGENPKDFDIATDAAPGQIKRLFRNCRLIGRRFRLAHLHFQDEILEVSTFRAAVPPMKRTRSVGTE